jgi:carbon storage regulator
MLVLSRRREESLVIDGVIRITILDGGNVTRLGIDAPRSVSIVRSELLVDSEAPVEGSARGEAISTGRLPSKC